MDVEFSDCNKTKVHGENQSKETSGKEKKAAIKEELIKMLQLPATSAYAIHRRRVLNKIMHLISIQRSASEDEELELLFAQMTTMIKTHIMTNIASQVRHEVLELCEYTCVAREVA
ncbi:hypothetical protein V2J09_008839 [Rumex salicifolius]